MEYLKKRGAYDEAIKLFGLDYVPTIKSCKYWVDYGMEWLSFFRSGKELVLIFSHGGRWLRFIEKSNGNYEIVLTIER